MVNKCCSRIYSKSTVLLTATMFVYFVAADKLSCQQVICGSSGMFVLTLKCSERKRMRCEIRLPSS